MKFSHGDEVSGSPKPPYACEPSLMLGLSAASAACSQDVCCVLMIVGRSFHLCLIRYSEPLTLARSVDLPEPLSTSSSNATAEI